MATKYKQDGHGGELRVFLDLILPYHPVWKQVYRSMNTNTQESLLALVESGHLSISQVLEETVSIVSHRVRKKPLGLIEKKGMDFDDKSDLKFATILKNPRTGLGRGDIGNVKHKCGALRVILWNDVTEQFEFFYIPHRAISKINDPGERYNRIVVTVTKQGSCKRLHPYRCSDFMDMIAR